MDYKFIESVRNQAAYPFIKCQHPKFVRNPYTREIVQTTCGVCNACIKARNSKAAFKCSLEEQEHKFCMFVTLTYDNEYVPLASPVLERDDIGEYYVLYNCCQRLKRLGEILAVERVDTYNSGHGFMPLLLSKVKTFGCIPYASKIDIQLFLKRFRKRIFTKSYEKIRYYAVSEYGPVHYRPHYHLLFFFESQVTLENFGQALRASWKYGRVDFSLSRGKCSSYVASYLNSDVSLPRLYSCDALKPFSLHSIYFAQGFYKDKRKAVYEDEPQNFMFLFRQVGNKIVDFMPWRSLTSLFFPRCRQFDSKSFYQLYDSYTILRQVIQVYGNRPVSELCELILNSDETQENSKILRYFSDYDEFTCSYMARSAGSIAAELYCSRHFLTFCCDGLDEHYVLKRIINFYKVRDYENLRTQYVVQQAYIEQWPYELNDPDWWKLFYVNALPSYSYTQKLTRMQVYKTFVLSSNYIASESVKHKWLNDLNNIFNQNL